MNAATAIAAAVARGADDASIQTGIEVFQGVKDRAELVAEIDGVRYINDTSATAPAAAIAAIEAYGEAGLHVIAGGFDKQSDLTLFAQRLARSARSVILLEGTATPILQSALEREGAEWIGPFDSMAAAVEAGSRAAEPGEIVILSPGCASFGLFRDEFHRGEQFRRAVASLRASTRVAT
jgi:UDP-N-acetylmuramoylalanine--D-glutamate ligase